VDAWESCREVEEQGEKEKKKKQKKVYTMIQKDKTKKVGGAGEEVVKKEALEDVQGNKRGRRAKGGGCCRKRRGGGRGEKKLKKRQKNSHQVGLGDMEEFIGGGKIKKKRCGGKLFPMAVLIAQRAVTKKEGFLNFEWSTKRALNLEVLRNLKETIKKTATQETKSKD